MSNELDDLFARHGPAYRWLATATGLLVFFTMAFSATIANVAVPDVMGAFGVEQNEAQFLATAFFATMTASRGIIAPAFSHRIRSGSTTHCGVFQS